MSSLVLTEVFLILCVLTEVRERLAVPERLITGETVVTFLKQASITTSSDTPPKTGGGKPIFD